MMKTIAIIGASKDRKKFGNKAVRAYKDAGWQVFPVNPKETSIENVRVYANILEVPSDIDRVSLYVPPQTGMRLLDDIAVKKPHEVFFNPGTESNEVLTKAHALGLTIVTACSIVAIGRNPANYH